MFVLLQCVYRFCLFARCAEQLNAAHEVTGTCLDAITKRTQTRIQQQQQQQQHAVAWLKFATIPTWITHLATFSNCTTTVIPSIVDRTNFSSATSCTTATATTKSVQAQPNQRQPHSCCCSSSPPHQKAPHIMSNLFFLLVFFSLYRSRSHQVHSLFLIFRSSSLFESTVPHVRCVYAYGVQCAYMSPRIDRKRCSMAVVVSNRKPSKLLQLCSVSKS